MLYHTFLTAVKQQMEKRLGDGYALTIRQVTKNNGLRLDGLCICEHGSRTAPTLYLNQCYQRFQEGESLTGILDELQELHRQSRGLLCADLTKIKSPEYIKERIAFRLINTASNTALLDTIPHVPVLDLAKVFYLYLGEDSAGAMTLLITNSHLRLWDMEPEKLEQLAAQNTPLLFPSRICPMEEALGDMISDRISCSCHVQSSPSRTPLYILSNRPGISGAACMLYPDVLKDFADRLESDLIVLPSSIHEVLLLPDKGDRQYEALTSIVTSINQLEVDLEDRLSNQVYLFSRSTGRLRMAPAIAAPLS